MIDMKVPETDLINSEEKEDAGDSLEALREKLKLQREQQKACLAKQKRTTFLAVETARRGTTFYDLKKLQEELKLEEIEKVKESTD